MPFRQVLTLNSLNKYWVLTDIVVGTQSGLRTQTLHLPTATKDEILELFQPAVLVSGEAAWRSCLGSGDCSGVRKGMFVHHQHVVHG